MNSTAPDIAGPVLAVDTSTTIAGIALYRGGPLFEHVWCAGRQHSTQVLPLIERSLRLVEVSPRDLRCVGVAIGPGSYTGVRVGIAIAQGLALGLDIPCYGVPTLDLAVLSTGRRHGRVLAVIEAGRGRSIVAGYTLEEGVPRCVVAAANVDDDGLVNAARALAPCLVTGELSVPARERVALEPDDVELATPAASIRRPALLAELVSKRLQCGILPEAASPEPIYLSRAT
ncbi:MAG: tRNA (adenosine(37)-N6)-threonylcarbamoyltransferase complex dimerization subunit type 1 TsaB [Chloroflexota bacterium]